MTDELKHRIAIIRDGLHIAEEKGGAYIGSRNNIAVLLEAYDELERKNAKLEANMFRGIDPRGRTMMRGFVAEISEQIDESETCVLENDVLLAAMGRHQI